MSFGHPLPHAQTGLRLLITIRSFETEIILNDMLGIVTQPFQAELRFFFFQLLCLLDCRGQFVAVEIW